MQLARLTVRNIRSYEDADIPLGPGTTLLVGDVGAGKTSLLYAIEMALFGFAEVDPVHLIRHRSREATVALGLTDGAHTYELRRRFSRKSRKGKEVFEADECVYGVDGAVQKYSPTELRQRAIDLLGFPDNPNARAHSDLWRWAVYIPQERMRDVLVQDPTERRETVRKALGLEQFKTAADNALLLARDIGARGRSLEDRADGMLHFEEDLGRFTAERDRTLGLLDGLRTAVAAAAEERRTSESRVESADRDARAVALDRGELQRTLAEIDGLRQRLGALEDQRGESVRRRQEILEESRTLDRAVAGRESVESSLRSIRSEVDILSAGAARREATRRERSTAESVRASAQEAARRAGEELRGADREGEAASRRLEEARSMPPVAEPRPASPRALGTIDTERGAARAALESAQAELAARRPILADLDLLLSSGSCPRCHQHVDATSFGVHRDEARTAVTEVEEQVRIARARVEGLETERSDRERFERDSAAWSRAEELRRDAARQWDESRSRLERARASAEIADRQLADATARLSAMPPLEEGSDGPDALRSARDRLADAERALVDLTRAETRRTALRQRAEELEAESVVRTGEIDRLHRDRDAAEVRRGELSARIASVDAEGILAAARMTARAAQERSETLGRELARRETELTAATGRIREAEAGRARRLQLLGEAEAERGLAGFLQGPFRDALTQLEERLLQRAQREFERTFSRAFQSLVEDPTIAARTDGAFTPAVEIDGEWTPAEALSGGERTALALAFRIALGQVIRGAGRLRLQTLILDEPTDGFSPEQVIRVGELLRELALPQVILVSHESGLAAVADHVVRVAKVDGNSVVRAEDTERPGGAEPPARRPRPKPELPAR